MPTIAIFPMKTVILVLMGFLFTPTASSETLWEIYIASPTPENAARVKKIEYSKGGIPEGYSYWHPDLKILEKGILEGDREAFWLALRLRAQADGALLEELNAILGKSIRPQTLMFLREISRAELSPQALRAILMTTGEDFVDAMEARQEEIRKRKEAIANTNEISLAGIKAKCLELMR